MNTIKIALLLIPCIIVTCLMKSTAQVNVIWANGIGSTSADIGQATAVDKHNNVYITGQISASTDFDPGPDSAMIYRTTVGDEDIFIAKYDPYGAYQWAISFGGNGNDKSYDIAVDDSGYIYITGIFWQICDFDPGPGVFNLSSNGFNDVFFAKYDSTGALVWAKRIGGIAQDYGRGIAVGNDGFIYLVGDFGEAVDFDANTGTAFMSSSGMSDVFITKYSTSGNYVWAKKIGTFHSEHAQDIALDASGNIYISGYFTGTTKFDPAGASVDITSTGGSDGFIAKYNNDGNFLWAQTLGGTGDDFAMGLTVDPSGTAFMTGYFVGSASFGSGLPPLVSSGSQDIFIAKYTSTGTPVWAKKVGGTTIDQGWGITLGKQNAVYITGRFNSSVIDFDPGSGVQNLYSAGGFDAYISKYDSSGNHLWVHGIGSASGDCGYGIAIDTAENIYLVGQYGNTISTNTSSGIKINTSNGGSDIFLFRLNDGCKNFIYHTEVACDSFTFNNQTYTSSGIYTDTFINHWGCDSIIRLALTINQSSIHNITAHYCDSVSINGTTYTSSGTVTHTYVSGSGCDSIVTYYLNIGSSDSITFSETACNIYHLNDTISYTTSGIYTNSFINQSGCDSTITLHLTVYNPEAIITQNGNILTASVADSYQWIECNSDEIIPGATSADYHVTVAGSYKVAITLNGCSDTSDCFAISPTTVTDPLSPEETIQVSPNPTHNELIVRLGKQHNNINYALYSTTGAKLTEEKNIKENVFKIDLSRYAEGIYLLILKDEKGLNRRIKIVKQ